MRPPSRPGGLRPTEVRVPVRRLSRYEQILGAEQYDRCRDAFARVAGLQRGRVVWHVNSTAAGGGVAEMMGPLIGYARDSGVDTRWLVIQGTPAFFALTKRLHNLLHADPGDGGEIGPRERRLYEGVPAPYTHLTLPTNLRRSASESPAFAHDSASRLP